MESKNVWKGLAYGGVASCIAEAATLPIDVVKTRLQLQVRRSVALIFVDSYMLSTTFILKLEYFVHCAQHFKIRGGLWAALFSQGTHLL